MRIQYRDPSVGGGTDGVGSVRFVNSANSGLLLLRSHMSPTRSASGRPALVHRRSVVMVSEISLATVSSSEMNEM